MDNAESTHRPDLAESEAGRLAAGLGDLPLGLAQAGGFLAETGMPAAQYLDLLATRPGELLDQSPPDAHPHSLVVAVRLATDRLADVDPAALALARVGAFLAPEPESIPADVLTAGDSRFALDVANNLAVDLRALGEYEPARQLGEDTLDRARRVLGGTHPLTRRAAANLSAIRHVPGGGQLVRQHLPDRTI